MSIRTLAARYVFPVTGDPIADGAVVVDQGRIVAVGRGLRRGPFQHLGNVALLPGLVNAHTHLELSGFAQPLGAQRRGLAPFSASSAVTCSPAERPKKGPVPFAPRSQAEHLQLADWIRGLMAARRASDSDPVAAVRQGLDESARHNVTALGEIAQPGWSAEPFSAGPIDATVFLELIAPTTARRGPALELARQHVEAWRPGCGWRAGLSPHAPYTVRREVFDAVVAFAARQHIPLAFHLAESREELEFLRSATGPLRTLLEDLGAWEPGGVEPGSRPLDYLRVLATAERSLVIHGNFLDAEEIAFLGQHAPRMAAVYCPRTHAWFGHAEYPLAQMLAAGVLVALGTDSRASSPDLNPLEEMRAVAIRHPAVPPDTIVRMGTIHGALALGVDTDLGALEPGKQARLAIVPLAERTADPYELLLGRTRG
jgi:cytosine/adenosine deaminase-related metal-dependent hydrolase